MNYNLKTARAVSVTLDGCLGRALLRMERNAVHLRPYQSLRVHARLHHDPIPHTRRLQSRPNRLIPLPTPHHQLPRQKSTGCKEKA